MPKYKEIQISDNALTVLEKRYLLKDKQGRVIESPKELFIRVAKFIAEADRNYGAGDDEVAKTAEKFYDMMADLEFLPNSPTLMNAGRELGQLSACFVLPVEDSMEEIFETNKHAALIHKTGGGTGFSFSRLRPRNSIVASTSGVASGPVSFMSVFNSATEAVKQGGTRRGANMGILRVDHPDILEFISCKEDVRQFINFNISVAITDSFMEAVEAGRVYPLIDPRSGRTHILGDQELFLSAADVFDRIIEQAWQTGEPGLIFIDRMNRLNPTHPHETIEATNPCGEQPLPPYDSCNLGSVNLGKFVLDPLPSDYSINEAAGGIDWSRLGGIVRRGVHFLDNVIDRNCYPLEQIEKQTNKNRRIGLGVMGWADMLVKLGLPYNSDAAFALAGEVMEFVETEGHKQSSELAKGRGKFPNWSNSKYATENVAMRNATVTTIAPTGTISIIAGCSSGIEPYYAIAFERNVLDGTRLVELNPLFEARARSEKFYTKELVETIRGQRSLAEVEAVPDKIKALFVTAADISPLDHVGMQAKFQEHCDSSVSKTINFPESASKEDVRTAFIEAYRSGCKGVTIYRDNSRPDQVLALAKQKSGPGGFVERRPAVLSGFTEKIKTGYGVLYVTVNLNGGRPFEVFAQIGKSGYTTMADTEAICRLISISLRAGVDVAQIIRQLRGIGGSAQVFSAGSKISSIPDAIAQVLNRHFGAKGLTANSEEVKSADVTDLEAELWSEMCPECNNPMHFQSGCFACQFCGYSNC